MGKHCKDHQSANAIGLSRGALLRALRSFSSSCLVKFFEGKFFEYRFIAMIVISLAMTVLGGIYLRLERREMSLALLVWLVLVIVLWALTMSPLHLLV